MWHLFSQSGRIFGIWNLNTSAIKRKNFWNLESEHFSLYWAVSTAVFGSDEMYHQLCCHVTFELATNASRYLNDEYLQLGLVYLNSGVDTQRSHRIVWTVVRSSDYPPQTLSSNVTFYFIFLLQESDMSRQGWWILRIHKNRQLHYVAVWWQMWVLEFGPTKHQKVSCLQCVAQIGSEYSTIPSQQQLSVIFHHFLKLSFLNKRQFNSISIENVKFYLFDRSNLNNWPFRKPKRPQRN